MRVVLDSNVLISALFWRGTPRRLVTLAAEGRFQSVTSPEILEEVDRVPGGKFRVSADDRADILRDIRSWSEVVVPGAPSTEVAVRDPGDRKVLACAFGGGADFLVTGDDDLLVLGNPAGVRIVTVRGFAAILDAKPSRE